jgi:hypothetical protein
MLMAPGDKTSADFAARYADVQALNRLEDCVRPGYLRTETSNIGTP